MYYNYRCPTHCSHSAKFWHTKSRLSTYTPVHLHDCIAVQAVPAFTTKVRRRKQSCVSLQEGKEEQEWSFRIPVKQYGKIFVKDIKAHLLESQANI